LALLLAASIPASASTPYVDYAIHCMGCHRSDGGGAPPDVPSLVTDLAVFLRVPGGREYLIRVPGAASSPLSDANLALVLNWVVSRFAPSDVASTFTPYTAEEVGTHRKRPLLDIQSERARLRALLADAEGTR
jgi:mono/diheme cytochrome c family protein